MEGAVPARLVARGVGDSKPAWLRPTDGEGRWGAAGCLTVVVGLLFLMPARYAAEPRFVPPAIEGAALLALVLMHPALLSRRSVFLRGFSLALLAALAATVAWSLERLVDDILNGSGTRAVDVLAGGGEIWLCNVLIFAMVYWEYDRGGPADRAHGIAENPDLLFPQMTDEHLARDWEPRFLDYFFVSFTCSSAYSPTDTMPLSRWCKTLFTLQAMLAILTVTLVAARAVNILPSH